MHSEIFRMGTAKQNVGSLCPTTFEIYLRYLVVPVVLEFITLEYHPTRHTLAGEITSRAQNNLEVKRQ